MELSAYLLDHGIVENVNLTNAPLDWLVNFTSEVWFFQYNRIAVYWLIRIILITEILLNSLEMWTLSE